MRRIIGILVIFCMVIGYSAPVLASGPDQEIGREDQTEQETDESEVSTIPPSDSWMYCHQLGKEDGGNISTGGSTAAGLAGGFLLGLIGTGLVVLLQSDSDPSRLALKNLEGDECQYAYIEAYNSQSVSKKRKAALVGGLIGTAVLVMIVIAAQD